MIVVMGSGARDRRARRSRASTRAASGSGVRAGAAVPAVPGDALLAALPPSVRAIAVLDRTKEPGALGEPLYLDVVAALTEAHADGERDVMPRVVGGRYGLSSKEFTPGMVAGVFDELARERPRRRFTSASTTTSRARASHYDPSLDIEPPDDGARDVLRPRRRTARSARTRTRSRSSAPRSDLHAQGYFVYDSKKSGSQTVSHLRFGPRPIRAPYLVQQRELRRLPPVRAARPGRRARPARRPARRCCSTAAHAPDEVWDALPRPVQEQILAKRIDVYAIDAGRIAREVGLAGRINIVLQTCFFAISGVLPRDAGDRRGSRRRSRRPTARRGAEVVERNQAAVDRALEGLHRIERARRA